MPTDRLLSAACSEAARDGRRWRAGALAAALILSGLPQAHAGEAADRQAVTVALQDSAEAWSRGDLDGFMKSYEASPDTLYIGHGAAVHGAAAIRAMYAARFGQGPAAMGHLALTLLEYRPLGPGYALVVGRFTLDPTAARAAPATGIFTLTFHKSSSGWHIIADHTSS